MTEKTVKEFLTEMASAGFEFDFIATHGDLKLTGNCEDGKIKVNKQLDKDRVLKKLNES